MSTVTTTRRWPPWLVRILLAMVVSQTAIFIARPVITYRALGMGASEAEVGLLVAAYSLLPTLVALQIGRYSDRRRPTPVLQAGLVTLVIGCAGLAFAPNLFFVTAATTVLGLGSLAVMIAAQSVIARVSDERALDRNFGLLSAAASLGQMIGPSIAGLVLSAGVVRSASVTMAFVIGGIACFVAMALSWGLGDRRVAGPASNVVDSPPAATGWWRILKLPGVMGGMFASLSLLSAVDLLVAFLPLLGEQRGIAPAVVGLLLSLRAGASVVSRLLIPALLARWGRVRLLLASTVASGLLVAVLPAVPQVWLLGLVLVLAGFFLGIGQPLTMSLVVQAVPAEARGAALSIRVMANKIGTVVLSSGVALATGLAGVGVAFFLLGGVLVASAAGVKRPGSAPSAAQVQTNGDSV